MSSVVSKDFISQNNMTDCGKKKKQTTSFCFSISPSLSHWLTAILLFSESVMFWTAPVAQQIF